MNEELQKAFTTLISQITSGVTSLSDKLPDLVNQLVAYNIVKSWILVGVFAVGTVVVIWALVEFLCLEKEYRAKPRSERREEDSWEGYIIVTSLLLALVIFLLVARVVTLVKLYFFPMVWIVDYLKDMIS